MMSLAACHDDPVASDASTDVDAPDGDLSGACAPQPFDASDDTEVDCSTFVTLPCGLPAKASVSECYPDLATCAAACQTNLLFYCVVTSSACTLDAGMLDAATTLECVSCLGGGRRPRGLVETNAKARFARLAHMEAASVRAFADLERSLAAFGAPARLVRGARRAREDERRHARAMTRIAKRFGASRPRVRVRAVKAPSLAELLVDDAIEGCANETFGALLLACDAKRSPDARIRRTLARIARDEASHAALAWEILRWGLPRVSRADRTRTLRALDDAWTALERIHPLASRLRAEIAW